MEYVIQQDTVDRLSSLHDEIHALSQGRYSDMVDVRVAAASMAATFQRILEDDIAPLSPDDDYDDAGWILEEYPDEGKPIPTWDNELPSDLQSPTNLIERIDPTWFFKKDGTRYTPSGLALRLGKALLVGDSCSAADYATIMRNAEYGYDEPEPHPFDQPSLPYNYCDLCQTRQSCVCAEAWNMNGDTIHFHVEGWLDRARRWQKHGLDTIGEIQSERHPVFVCECPWENCLVRQAAGYMDWKDEFLAAL